MRSSDGRVPAGASERTERGSAAVEFALLLPIVLLMLLALVQVGALTRDRLLLAQSSRAGAREAAVTADGSLVEDAAARAAPGLDPSRLEVAVERAGARGSPVTVSVGYDVPIAPLLAGWLFPSSVRLDSTTVARQEFG